MLFQYREREIQVRITETGTETGRKNGIVMEEEPAGRPDELPDAAQQPEEGNANGQGQENGQINLNTADLAQLMTLPGIGQRRAEDILAYRAMHGGFQAVEELTQISGIGEKLLAKIADRVCVG